MSLMVMLILARVMMMILYDEAYHDERLILAVHMMLGRDTWFQHVTFVGARKR